MFMAASGKCIALSTDELLAVYEGQMCSDELLVVYEGRLCCLFSYRLTSCYQCTKVGCVVYLAIV